MWAKTKFVLANEISFQIERMQDTGYMIQDGLNEICLANEISFQIEKMQDTGYKKKEKND